MEDKEQKLFDLARDIFIHNKIEPSEAYKRASAFIEYEYDGIRTINQTYQVRYTVESTKGVYTLEHPIVNIACTDIKGFKVMHERYKDRNNSAIPSWVEVKAREQIDKLLLEAKARAGLINVREVNSFNGDF